MKNLSTIYRLLLVMLFVISLGYAHAKTNAILDCDTPVIYNQPVNDTLCDGNSVTFYIYTSGSSTYEWQVNSGGGFEDISNGGVYSIYSDDDGNSELTISPLPHDSMNGYQFRCIVENIACSLYDTSNVAMLITNLAYFIKEPTDAIVCALSDHRLV